MSAGTIQLVIALAGTAFLVVVLGAGIVYCVRSAKENARASRDAGVRAGDYPIPYVIHFRGLAAGLAIVLNHNLWTPSWRVLVTLLGWLFVIGGAVRIVVPQQSEAMGRWMLKHPRGMLVAPIVLLAVRVLAAAR